MRFLQYLKEMYLTSLQLRGEPYSIYKNPDAYDMEDFKKEMRKFGTRDNFPVRFIADMDKQNLYVWDANMAIHYDIKRYLERHDDLSDNVKEDDGVIKDNKIKSSLNTNIKKGYPGYFWLNKYFAV